jgi:hypothetical protein
MWVLEAINLIRLSFNTEMTREELASEKPSSVSMRKRLLIAYSAKW